jgi:alkylated DNA repair dioxygenase AlkB
VSAGPDGLAYRPEAIAPDEEAALLAFLGSLELHAVTMRGRTARRTVRHYGYAYDYETWRVVPGEPLPAELAPARRRCADTAGLVEAELAQTLVTRYPPGATIGWHRDAPAFGIVAGLSLGAPCRMRFQRGEGAEREVTEVALEPRSAYVLAGSARTEWQHSIPPAKAERWSLTFRTLRQRER